MRGLLALVLLVMTGCFGTVSRWDGEGPIKREEVTWTEIGGGPGGAVLSAVGTDDRKRVVTPAGVFELTVEGPLEVARVAAGRLYTVEGLDVVERALGRDGLGKARIVAHVDGTLEDLSISGEEIACATEKHVVAGKPPTLHEVWKGDPRAVALDSVHRLVWIHDDGAAPTLQCVALDDGAVVHHYALTAAFHDHPVKIVLAEDAVVVYVPTGSLKDAVLVAPGLDATAPLIDSDMLPQRICGLIGPPPGPNGNFDESNRVAALPGNRFLALNLRNPTTDVALIWSMTDPDDGPPRTRLHMPQGTPSSIEGVGWDENGVVLSAGDQRIVVPPSGRRPEDVMRLHPTLTSLRHGVNYAINVVLGVGEFFGPVIVPVVVVAAAALVVAGSPLWGAYVLCHT